jgi:hypothetical protein
LSDIDVELAFAVELAKWAELAIRERFSPLAVASGQRMGFLPAVRLKTACKANV